MCDPIFGHTLNTVIPQRLIFDSFKSFGVFKSIYLANAKNLLGSNVTYVWLGGSNVNNGTWIWIDGQPFSYTNWAKSIIKNF